MVNGIEDITFVSCWVILVFLFHNMDSLCIIKKYHVRWEWIVVIIYRKRFEIANVFKKFVGVVLLCLYWVWLYSSNHNVSDIAKEKTKITSITHKVITFITFIMSPKHYGYYCTNNESFGDSLRWWNAYLRGFYFNEILVSPLILVKSHWNRVLSHLIGYQLGGIEHGFIEIWPILTEIWWFHWNRTPSSKHSFTLWVTILFWDSGPNNERMTHK